MICLFSVNPFELEKGFDSTTNLTVTATIYASTGPQDGTEVNRMGYGEHGMARWTYFLRLYYWHRCCALAYDNLHFNALYFPASVGQSQYLFHVD